MHQEIWESENYLWAEGGCHNSGEIYYTLCAECCILQQLTYSQSLIFALFKTDEYNG